MKAAIFDVDNTITTRDTFFLFFWYIISQKPLRFLRAYRLPFSLLRTRAFGANRQLVKEDVFRLLNGLPEAEVKDICLHFVRQVATKYIAPRAIKAMEHHQKEGFKIILLSASPELYLTHLGKFLNADYCIGTKIEIKNGNQYAVGTHCYGPEKMKRLQQFLSFEKLTLDFKESFFYSDHHSDLPIFDNVGNPVAVNASSKLKSMAIRKGWSHYQWK